MLFFVPFSTFSTFEKLGIGGSNIFSRAALLNVDEIAHRSVPLSLLVAVTCPQSIVFGQPPSSLLLPQKES